MLKSALLIGLMSLAMQPATDAEPPERDRTRDIEYSSHYDGDVVIFSPDGFQTGPLIAEPPYPTRTFSPEPGVQCLSLGLGRGEAYAIKRPIRSGDRFRCLQTSFVVARCFERCRAAVIRRETANGNHPALRSSYYVRDCQGIVAISRNEDMPRGIEFDALLLTSNVGILPSPTFPNC